MTTRFRIQFLLCLTICARVHVKWHTYWIPFPNKHLAPSIWELRACPRPLLHSRHYLSVPWISSSRVYLKGSILVGLQAYLNYTASHAAKKPKPVLEPVKPPSATLFSEHEQVGWYSPTLRTAGPHIFCVAQTNNGALCSHRMVFKICSQYSPPSHCKSRHKNRFSFSAGFPLPFFF